MILWILIVLIILLSVLLFWIGRWIYQQWEYAKIIGRLAPGLTEPNPFFKLLDILTNRSHAMGRHSPMTTNKEQYIRAKKGISPDGHQGKPTSGGRWISHYPMLQAIEESQMIWNSEHQGNKKAYTFQFDKDIGIVINRETLERVDTTFAKVVLSKKGEVITAFPTLKELVEGQPIIFIKQSDEEEYS